MIVMSDHSPETPTITGTDLQLLTPWGHFVDLAVRKVISEAWQLLELKLLCGKQKPFCSVPQPPLYP